MLSVVEGFPAVDKFSGILQEINLPETLLSRPLTRLVGIRGGINPALQGSARETACRPLDASGPQQYFLPLTHFSFSGNYRELRREPLLRSFAVGGAHARIRPDSSTRARAATRAADRPVPQVPDLSVRGRRRLPSLAE